MISLELEASFPDEATAEAVLAALDPDNAGYVESELRGPSIVFRMSSESAGTLRSTADDLMACLKTAEASAGLSRSGHRRLDASSRHHRLYTAGCGRPFRMIPHDRRPRDR